MSNNSGRAKVKIVKNERDPPLFTADKILKDSKPCNQKQELDVVAMFVNEPSRVIGHNMTENRMFTLCRMIT
jgi:hypothetical protein